MTKGQAALDYIFTTPDLRILSYAVRKTGPARVASDGRPSVAPPVPGTPTRRA